MASGDNVRITPSLRSKTGMIWNRKQITFPWWEFEVHFRISGRERMGADGLAFWYTTERMIAGNVFGSKDRWNGLGLIFDSYDNDNKRNNPYISVILNDGTISYKHDEDGAGQMLGGCFKDFRNKPYPVRARLTYYLNVLTLQIQPGLTGSNSDYEMCFRAENVHLPRHGYIGASAATGDLADDHDIFRMLTWSLSEHHSEVKHQATSEQELQKLEKNLDEYQRKADQAKKDYIREHPDEKELSDKNDEMFDSGMSQEMRQIFQGQSHLFDAVKQLNDKVDHLVGRQENTLSLLSQSTQLQQQQQQQLGVSQQPGSPSGLDVGSLLRSHQELVSGLREVRAVVAELSQRQQTSGAGDQRQVLAGLQAGLQHVQRELTVASQLVQQMAQRKPAAQPPCASTMVVFAALAMQLLVVVVFVVWRDRRQVQAKKYY